MSVFPDLDHHLNRIELKVDGLYQRLDELETRIMPALDDVKAALAAYAAKVDAYVAAAEAHQTTVADAVAAALATEDAGDDVDLNALKTTIDASAAKVPDPPVSPAV